MAANRFSRKRQRTEPHGLTTGFGIASSELPQELLSGLENGAGSWTFGGKTFTCQRIVIPHDQIEESTIVDDRNERNQEWLSEYGLRQLIASIKKSKPNPKTGNIQNETPVIAYRRKDGKIVVLDGSCRRFSCIAAGADLVADAIDEDLSQELGLRSQISSNFNLNKPISWFEKGYKYNAYLAENENATESDIADYFKDHQSNVNTALRAIQLPSSWINALPYPTEITRAGLQFMLKLHKAIESAPKHVKPFDPETVMQTISAEVERDAQIPDAKKNQAYLDSIQAEFAAVNEPKATKPAFQELGDKSRVRITSSKNKYKIELEDADDVKGQEFLAELTLLLKKFNVE
ncbi:hypothetical protein [Vibrio gangliei]|uniref:hypothetical protein n=1 Tax=Vibrio gangliei TaxID=2077090 RepID=UPI000D01D816|nr:hypothetical protein [Vibrio gangliei]